MQRDLLAIASAEHDVLIIGAGMFGICAAWDAVLRGFSVALVDKGDYCSGTSANSFRIVHGGIRYLQHGDIVRIRSSCRERTALLRTAPHLVQPLPIVVPTYGHGKNSRWFLAAGVLAYGLFTLDRNWSIRDPGRRIPWGRLLNRREVLDLFPGLDSAQLTGAVEFFDGQMYNPTRLAISFLRAAVAAGAKAANYVKARKFLRRGDRIIGVEVEDTLSGDVLEVRAKTVLNAAGPWAEDLLAQGLPTPVGRRTPYSRDACFVLKRSPTHGRALALQSQTKDPDALLSRQARHLFVVPWRDRIIVGVWHKPYDSDPDRVDVSVSELEGYIEELNWAYPTFHLKYEDVTFWNWGLLPFGENESDAKDLSYGKRSILIDHQREDQLAGLVSLIGVRYTMARGDAARAVDLLAAKLGRRAPRPPTHRLPVHGGNINDFQAFVKQATKSQGEALPPHVMRALAHNYGSEYQRVLRYAEGDVKLLETIANSTVIKAEVPHAVQEEGAVKLSDVVLRRTDLGTGGYPGVKALSICGALMAKDLGWDEAQLEQEIKEVEKVFHRFGSFTRTAATRQ